MASCWSRKVPLHDLRLWSTAESPLWTRGEMAAESGRNLLESLWEMAPEYWKDRVHNYSEIAE